MITSSSFIISSPDVRKSPESTLPEYAFIGRSNVGKSSLINCLTNHIGLAKTSQKPGKTLLINHFAINAGQHDAWNLVDLPGYGYAVASLKQREILRKMIEDYCLMRQPLVSMFVLVDCRHEPQKVDLEFMEWLGEKEVPFAIVFTKVDKLGRERLRLNIEAYKKQLLEVWEELPPIFVTSAEKKTGAAELLQYIEELNQQMREQ